MNAINLDDPFDATAIALRMTQIEKQLQTVAQEQFDADTEVIGSELDLNWAEIEASRVLDDERFKGLAKDRERLILDRCREPYTRMQIAKASAKRVKANIDALNAELISCQSRLRKAEMVDRAHSRVGV